MPPKYSFASILMNGFLFYFLQNFNYHTTDCSPRLTCLVRGWEGLVLGSREGVISTASLAGTWAILTRMKMCMRYPAIPYLELYLTEIFPPVCQDTHIHTHAHAHTPFGQESAGLDRLWCISTVQLLE